MIVSKRANSHAIDRVADTCSLTDPNSLFIYDPKSVSYILIRKEWNYFLNNRKDVVFVLCIQAKNNETKMVPRRIGTNIREIKIHRHNNAVFNIANVQYVGIRLTNQVLVMDRHCIVPIGPEEVRDLNRHIFIDLEFHAASGSEMYTTLSLASSAAYDTAACMSSRAIDGKLFRISSVDTSAARLSRMTETITRVPLMQAFP